VQHELDHLDGKLIVDYEGAIYYPKKKQEFYEKLFKG
jgi:peptide deformylase